jgi:phospholipid/cholesterol/gamma-HCH transport system permease protein
MAGRYTSDAHEDVQWYPGKVRSTGFRLFERLATATRPPARQTRCVRLNKGVNGATMALSSVDEATLERSDEGSAMRLRPLGFWGISNAALLEQEIDALVAGSPKLAVIDLSRLDHLDTSGAWLLFRLAKGLIGAGASVKWTGVSANAKRLLETIGADAGQAEPEAETKRSILDVLFGPLGRRVVDIGADLSRGLGVFGSVIYSLGVAAAHPSRLRFSSIVHHLDRSGLRAVPIVFLMSFLIGGIIAQQAAFQLRAFGASLYVVDLVGVLALREIGVLLTAIMIAGRSGSAYTAEIGSMKMREEIDAIKVIGLDPVEILIVPRLVALIVALPLLTVVSDMAALMGGAMTSLLYVDMPIATFVSRLRDAVALNTFMVGIIKAPFMALITGIIAAIEGIKVEGSAESLGRHTTASVVKAIFMVIVADGIFAVIFASLGY